MLHRPLWKVILDKTAPPDGSSRRDQAYLSVPPTLSPESGFISLTDRLHHYRHLSLGLLSSDYRLLEDKVLLVLRGTQVSLSRQYRKFVDYRIRFRP